MKKKLLLIISMFLFITNVRALTFDVSLTNIEDKGNNGTIGSIENIDITNKELDVLFQDIGDEVNFDITITNSGDRAGNLKEIKVTSQNDKIEYTNNLPENGLAINGNDSNTVTITAKVLEGAVNGKTSSHINVVYKYDEGSCPEGEILTEDESMCLCPEGYERNEEGRCVKPEKKIECADDEIYNETKKICEKKVTPTPDKKITPINPKTLDNIAIITVLFIISALALFLILSKKIKTKRKKIVLAIITGVVTFSLSFTALAGIFGLDNLLGAIVNPITKSKEIVLTVNEEIDLIETWDGNCDLETAGLTPDNIFDGGSGTESDPYQIKTAEQLSCFAKSVNKGTTYEGQYIKQTKNIKLNDHLNDHVVVNDLTNENIWTPIGNNMYNSFNGTYDGDNKIISGLYINNSDSDFNGVYVGLFGNVNDSILKNITLSDVYIYIDDSTYTYGIGVLASESQGNLTISNIKTSGNLVSEAIDHNVYMSGVAYEIKSREDEFILLENIENNINIKSNFAVGIVYDISSSNSNLEEDTIVIRNVVNKGNMTAEYSAGIAYTIYGTKVLLEGLVNKSNFNITVPDDDENWYYYDSYGLAQYIENATLKDSYNTGNFNVNRPSLDASGLIGEAVDVNIDNCYNSGNIVSSMVVPEGVSGSSEEYAYSTGGNFGGLASKCHSCNITNSYNTGNISVGSGQIGGLVGDGYGNITNSYNLGDLYGITVMGGLVGFGDFIIDSSYNKGNIVVWAPNPYYEYTITLIGGLIGGSDYGYRDVTIRNSYNEGNISVLAEIADQNSGIAGLAQNGYGTIENSYNRGNLYSKYSKIYQCGISCSIDNIKNVYNSGTITFDNAYKTEVDIWWENIVYSGISSWANITNTYNLGDITVNDDYGAVGIGGGIADYDSYIDTRNSVNTGDITLIFNAPLTSQRNITMYGINTSYYPIQNNFNAGSLTLIDNTDDQTVSNPDLSHYVRIGEITEFYVDGSSGNKFTNQSGYALACYANDECSLEDSLQVGALTNEDAPGILSIINGDNAFNDELDDYGLPTLKVFNE